MAGSAMISDNDLLLYHYRDGLDATERERIRIALREEPALAARLQALINQLDEAAAMPEVPAPQEARQRWEAALALAQRNEAATLKEARFDIFHWLRWPAFGVAALLAIVVATRLDVGTQPRVIEQTATNVAAPTDAPALPYERGMQVHLASTERQLAELTSASAPQRAALIDAVIAQNRLYALAAERAGDERLARALRSFAPILENLADEPSSGAASSGDLAQLNFELRVMQARLAAESATPPATQPLTL
jgi:hypothetical protein